MQVVVDFSRCDAHGRCVDVCPEVFALDDNDDLVLIDSSPPEALRPQVEDAARQCPKAAISVE